jgi:hypothetical protein
MKQCYDTRALELNRCICFSILTAWAFNEVSIHVLAGSGVLGPGLGLKE